MKDTGMIAKLMVRADSFMQMEMFIQANGKTIKLTESEFTHILMVHDMRDVGRKINSMVKVLKLGQMVQVTKEPMLKVKSTVSAASHGLIPVHIQAIL